MPSEWREEASDSHTDGAGSRHLAALDARDRQVAALAGYGRRMGRGKCPALLVVDVTYDFCGPPGLSIAEAITVQRRACGEDAWKAVSQIGRLLEVFRSRHLQVAYSKMRAPSDSGFDRGLWAAKNIRAQEDYALDGRDSDHRIVETVAPLPGEQVFAKNKPSMFFGTGLLSYLTVAQVDSVVVCGGATSGCVYATVIDAFSHNLKVTVIDDACFDRLRVAHQVFLCDIDLKYGDVMTTDELIEGLQHVD